MSPPPFSFLLLLRLSHHFLFLQNIQCNTITRAVNVPRNCRNHVKYLLNPQISSILSFFLFFSSFFKQEVKNRREQCLPSHHLFYINPPVLSLQIHNYSTVYMYMPTVLEGLRIHCYLYVGGLYVLCDVGVAFYKWTWKKKMGGILKWD